MPSPSAVHLHPDGTTSLDKQVSNAERGYCGRRAGRGLEPTPYVLVTHRIRDVTCRACWGKWRRQRREQS